MDKIKFIGKKMGISYYTPCTYLFQVYDNQQLNQNIIDVVSFVLKKDLDSMFQSILGVCFDYPYVLAFVSYTNPLEDFDERIFPDGLDNIPMELFNNYEQQKIGDYSILTLNNKQWNVCGENITSYKERVTIELGFKDSSILFSISNMELSGVDDLVTSGQI